MASRPESAEMAVNAATQASRDFAGKQARRLLTEAVGIGFVWGWAGAAVGFFVGTIVAGPIIGPVVGATLGAKVGAALGVVAGAADAHNYNKSHPW